MQIGVDRDTASLDDRIEQRVHLLWSAGLIDEVRGLDGIREGLATLFLRHTSASLLVQENADPVVQDDLERFLARLVPDGDPLFRHRDEGPDDMPAHVRTALSSVQLVVHVLGEP